MVSNSVVPKDDEGELDFDRDLEGFEEVEVNLGEKIDWPGMPKFKGVYLGSEEIMAPDSRTGEIVPVQIHTFKDTHGETWFTWHSPELDRGLDKVDVGWEIMILWTGKSKPPGGKNEMNHFRVAMKPPVI